MTVSLHHLSVPKETHVIHSGAPSCFRRFKARLGHEESVLFLAEEAGNAVGFAQLYPSCSSVAMAQTFVLNDVFVVQQARRRGSGEMLLRAVASYARDIGAVRLSLSTASTNTGARVLYESIGWRLDEQFLVYVLVMEA